MTVDQLRGAVDLTSPMDLDRIERACREIIEAIGEDPEREGLRVDPKTLLKVQFDVAHDEMVILKDIPFYSICEHHFMPFHGIAAVGYIPDGKVVGLSKLARLVEAYARRPQIQEQLTGQIADSLMETLQPDGVAVVIEAEHLCMTQRGVKKPGSRLVTSATRGTFRSHDVTRGEFLALVRGS